MKVIDFLAGVVKAAFVILFILIIAVIVILTIYPAAYTEEIKQYSEVYDLDPHMVMAMINVESRFDKNAISEKGAQGLMQVTPETGTWVAEQMQLPYQTEEELVKPVNNIRIGTWLIRHYIDRYDGNINRALAAYNAGPSVVDEWLQQGIVIDEREYSGIPYPETRHYIKKVRSQTNVYRRIDNVLERDNPVFDFVVEAFNEVKGLVKDKVENE